MSKIFYDRLLVLEEVETEIEGVVKTKEEKEELWDLVDEILNNRIIASILGKLPKEEHQNFLEKFEKAPQDEGLFHFLTEKVGEDIEEFLKKEIEKLKVEILKEIKGNG